MGTIMTCERVEGEFDPPFCGYTEVQIWLDLMAQLEAVCHGFQIYSNGEIAVGRQNGITSPGFVVWKTVGERGVGLATAGQLAGYLVYRQGDVARPHRPLAIDGAEFSSGEGLARLEKLALPEAVRWPLQTILAVEESGFYPELIATCLILLDYPFDEQTFLGNIERENLRYRLLPSEYASLF